jgi:hypothetical protein
MLLIYEDQPVNANYGNNHSLLLKSYDTHILCGQNAKKKIILSHVWSGYRRSLD